MGIYIPMFYYEILSTHKAYSNGRTIIPLVGAESCRVAVWLLIIRAYLPVGLDGTALEDQ